MGPVKNTSTPAAEKPASRADSNIDPDSRVSFPIITFGLLVDWLSFVRTFPAAKPSFVKKSTVIGNLPALPRIPSVPKYFLIHFFPNIFLSLRHYACG